MLESYEISLDSSTLLDTQQLDHFVLATLQFSTLATGTSPVTPTLNSAGDSGGSSLNPALGAGQIDVVQTPEPGTMGLFLVIGILMSLGEGIRGLRSNNQLRFSGKQACPLFLLGASPL